MTSEYIRDLANRVEQKLDAKALASFQEDPPAFLLVSAKRKTN